MTACIHRSVDRFVGAYICTPLYIYIYLHLYVFCFHISVDVSICPCAYLLLSLCLFVCSFVRLFVRSFVCLLVRSFVCLFARSFVRLFVCLCVYGVLLPWPLQSEIDRRSLASSGDISILDWLTHIQSSLNSQPKIILVRHLSKVGLHAEFTGFTFFIHGWFCTALVAAMKRYHEHFRRCALRKGWVWRSDSAEAHDQTLQCDTRRGHVEIFLLIDKTCTPDLRHFLTVLCFLHEAKPAERRRVEAAKACRQMNAENDTELHEFNGSKTARTQCSPSICQSAHPSSIHPSILVKAREASSQTAQDEALAAAVQSQASLRSPVQMPLERQRLMLMDHPLRPAYRPAWLLKSGTFRLGGTMEVCG